MPMTDILLGGCSDAQRASKVLARNGEILEPIQAALNRLSCR
jgi:hypothetical protein